MVSARSKQRHCKRHCNWALVFGKGEMEKEAKGWKYFGILGHRKSMSS